MVILSLIFLFIEVRRKGIFNATKLVYMCKKYEIIEVKETFHIKKLIISIAMTKKEAQVLILFNHQQIFTKSVYL